jgi:hypothetical protein
MASKCVQRSPLNPAASTRMAHAVVRMTSPGGYLYCRGLEALGSGDPKMSIFDIY